LPSVRELQREVGIWANLNFPTDDSTISVLGLVEEVGEVCRAILKREQGIRGTEEEWTEKIREEMGDVFIKLCHVAELEGVDLQSIIESRWSEVSQRNWLEDKAGHGMPDD
jgi:NTP pyrophosphatase (non-canonical NTP hydrolase)